MRVAKTRPDLSNAIGRDKIPPPTVEATRLKVATFNDVFRRGDVKVGLKYSMDILFVRTRSSHSSSELAMIRLPGNLLNMVNSSLCCLLSNAREFMTSIKMLVVHTTCNHFEISRSCHVFHCYFNLINTSD